MPPLISITDALSTATSKLPHSSTAQADAEILLAYVLQKPRSYLYTWPEKALSLTEQHAYRQLVERRIAGVPIAYLTGSREFWSLPIKVTHDTLIPRPETELLVENALAYCGHISAPRILDLGTGSGCIALALAKEKPQATVWACDISEAALIVARENAKYLQLANITFLKSNWFSHIEQRDFDLIVSNPPYIATGDPHLEVGDIRFEPKTALLAGIQGLDALCLITQQAPAYLKAQGALLLEFGYQQSSQIAELLASSYFTSHHFLYDFAGHIRACKATL